MAAMCRPTCFYGALFVKYFVVFLLLFLLYIGPKHLVHSILCYDCTVPPYPATFDDTETRFDTSHCPEKECYEGTEQICVKITYNDSSAGGILRRTRACLADLRASTWQTYIPGNTFVGCRNAALPRRRINKKYLEQDVRPIDRSSQFCFCDDMDRCNMAVPVTAVTYVSLYLITAAAACAVTGGVLWHQR